jgi:hypothetical protein
MKIFVVALVLISALSCANKKSIDHSSLDSDLLVRIYLEHEYSVPYHGKLNYEPDNDSIFKKKFDIKVNLINNSDSVISIWLMICSWDMDFIINNTYIYIDGKDCNANFPALVKINSKDSVSFDVTLSRSIEYDNPAKNSDRYDPRQAETTKLGLIPITSINCKKPDQFYKILFDQSKWQKILWSNPLYLNK